MKIGINAHFIVFRQQGEFADFASASFPSPPSGPSSPTAGAPIHSAAPSSAAVTPKQTNNLLDDLSGLSLNSANNVSVPLPTDYYYLLYC